MIGFLLSSALLAGAIIVAIPVIILLWPFLHYVLRAERAENRLAEGVFIEVVAIVIVSWKPWAGWEFLSGLDQHSWQFIVRLVCAYLFVVGMTAATRGPDPRSQTSRTTESPGPPKGAGAHRG